MLSVCCELGICAALLEVLPGLRAALLQFLQPQVRIFLHLLFEWL
jgi:hypothetical protein